MMHRSTLLALAFALVAGSLLQAQDIAAEKVTALPTSEYLLELEKLAKKCDELNLTMQARRTRTWWPATRSDQAWLVVMEPEETTEPDNSEDLVTKWRSRFQLLRRRHAVFLIDEIQKHLDQKDELAAYRLVWRAYREDPTNSKIRFVLQSFLKATDVESKVRLSTIAHPKYGWPAKTFYRVQLPHFRVVSNAAPSVLEKWTRHLEMIFSVWTQAYPDLWLAPGSLKNRFSGRNVPLERKAEMNVVLFSSREEYLKQIGKSDQFVDNSVGYYAAQEATSFFYVEDDAVAFPTLIHELTHQILQEASVLRGTEPWKSPSDFWVVEALALHSESIWIGSDLATVGGWESPRLQVARYRAMRENFWIDWEALRSLSAETWRQQSELAKIYTQSAGLAHFWLDSSDPKKREAFFKYLLSVYRNKPNPEVLYTTLPLSKFREQYEDMLQVSASMLSQLFADRQLEDCVLIGCELPESGLIFLQEQASSLKWLDLTFVPIKDEHCKVLSQFQALERLSLEGTALTQTGVAYLEELKNLQELDLTATAMDDAAVPSLVKLSNLETLWLTQTKVSDAALTELAGMRKLTFLQLDETQVSPDGWKIFLQKRPDLAPKSP